MYLLSYGLLKTSKRLKKNLKNNPFTLRSDQQVTSPHAISKHCLVKVMKRNGNMDLRIYFF